jgi:hypothetical protein
MNSVRACSSIPSAMAAFSSFNAICSLHMMSDNLLPLRRLYILKAPSTEGHAVKGPIYILALR